MMAVLLAWMPLLEPLAIDDYWFAFLLPLIVAVAVVYKTIRTHDMRLMPRQATYLAVQIFVFMMLTAGILLLITRLA